jgi:hypothetical protein
MRSWGGAKLSEVEFVLEPKHSLTPKVGEQRTQVANNAMCKGEIEGPVHRIALLMLSACESLARSQ